MKKMIEVVLVLVVLGVFTSCQSTKKEISQETTRSMSGAAGGNGAAGGESAVDEAAGGNEAAGGESAVDEAAGENGGAVEEEDPAAHWARNWEECMEMPDEEQMEASSLVGNISEKDGKVYLHVHANFGRADYTVVGGHLLSATLNGACELVVTRFHCKIDRQFDDETGLNLYKFD